MKAKLQEKYILPSYKSQLFSTMINLKQMNFSVAEYSAKFEEARLRCSEFHFICEAISKLVNFPFHLEFRQVDLLVLDEDL